MDRSTNVVTADLLVVDGLAVSRSGYPHDDRQPAIAGMTGPVGAAWWVATLAAHHPPP